MKHLKIFLLLPVFTTANAQSLDIQRLFTDIKKETPVNWGRKSQVHSFEETYTTVNGPGFTCDCGNWKIRDSTHFKNLHWVDINNDQRDDLIYSSWCKPYPETWIFLRTADSLKLIYRSGGIITMLDRTRHNGSKIVVRSDGCCCDQFSSVQFLTIAPHADTIVEGEIVIWYAQMPIEIPVINQVVTTTSSISLRFEPKVDNKIVDWECNDEFNIKGNIVATFRPSTTVHIVAERKIRNKQWYFVVIPPSNTSVEEDFENQLYITDSTYVLGWVSGKELFD